MEKKNVDGNEIRGFERNVNEGVNEEKEKEEGLNYCRALENVNANEAGPTGVFGYILD